MTCEKRAEMLEKTLQSFKESDWPEIPRIVMDNGHEKNPRIAQTKNSRRLLQLAAKDDWDFMIFMEDDIIVNKHIWHNLQTWKKLLCLKIATLYNQDEKPFLDQWQLGGSQAIMIRRDQLDVVLEAWENDFGGEMQDLRIYRSINVPVANHLPNLVQHQPCKSTWGGPFHDSPTFDLEWKRLLYVMKCNVDTETFWCSDCLMYHIGNAYALSQNDGPEGDRFRHAMAVRRNLMAVKPVPPDKSKINIPSSSSPVSTTPTVSQNPPFPMKGGLADANTKRPCGCRKKTT